MQSKTLSSEGRLFNATLFRKNLSRFWPLWGMATFLGSLLPLSMLMQVLRDGRQAADPLDATLLYYSALTSVVPVVSLLYAVLCAMTVWSYLYAARSAGLMHTLPIRRKGLFVTNYLSGMAMMLIPYAVTGALCVLVTAFNGAFEPVGLLNTVLGVLAMSFFYFSTATAVAFVTGNLLALPVLYFLLHFLAVLVDWLVSDLAAGFLFGLTSWRSGAADVLSPTVYLLGKLGVDTVRREGTVLGQTWTRSVLERVTLENFWVVGVYALVGVALTAAAYALYRRRQNERAGDVVAVGWLRPVFRYGVAALSALLGGRALYALFWESFQDNGDTTAALPMAVCMAVAGIIGYYAAAMLLAKSLRVFRGSWLGPVAVTAAAALVCLSLHGDLLGIAERVPEAGQITELELSTAGNRYTFRPGADDELLEQVRRLHAAIVADRDHIRESSVGPVDEAWSVDLEQAPRNVSDQSVRLVYHLTGGATVSRWYDLPISRDRIAQPGTYDQLLDALVNSEPMRLKRLHLGDDGYQTQSAFIRGEQSGYFDLNSREAQALLDAVGRDAAAGTWGEYDWFGDERGDYAVDISVDFQRADPKTGAREYDSINITLRPAMTETLGYLLDLGALTEGDLVTYEDLYQRDRRAWGGVEAAYAAPADPAPVEAAG